MTLGTGNYLTVGLLVSFPLLYGNATAIQLHGLLPQNVDFWDKDGIRRRRRHLKIITWLDIVIFFPFFTFQSL